MATYYVLLTTYYLLQVCSTWWEKQPCVRKWLPFECASMSEGKALTLVTQRERLRAHHTSNLSRVYPGGTRVNSSNISASSLLACFQAGCQMTCLNYQTFDGGMQINRGLFQLNGGCGYVLQRSIAVADELLPGAEQKVHCMHCTATVHIRCGTTTRPDSASSYLSFP